jgi:nitrogen fixation protein FixH
MEDQNVKSARWNPWPVSIVAFFAVAIVGCVVFVVFCNLHPTDLVAADYYEQELRYQGQIDRMNRANALVGQASVQYNPEQKRIDVLIPGAQGSSGTVGKVELYRPSSAGLDRMIALEVDKEGRQSIDTAKLAPGLWDVKVTWVTSGQDFFIKRRIRI